MSLPQLTQEQRTQAIMTIAEAAVQSEKQTEVPAEFTTSQCIYESYYLSVAPENNCFGIKFDPRDIYGYGRQYSLTQEYLNGKWESMTLAFESYLTLTDCFNDHARLISTGIYEPAYTAYQKTKDIDKYIVAVSKLYATDPVYAANMICESHSKAVVQAVESARQASKV